MSTATLVRPEGPLPGPPPTDRRTSLGRANRFVPVLLVLAGILILLYPVIATQYNNFQQRQFSEEYGNLVQEVPPNQLLSELDSARAYNSTIEGIPILDPWLLRVAQDPGSAQYQEYASQLDRFNVMARVRVPSAKIDLPVFHGTSDEVLAKGVGHLYGTSLPVGAIDTHAVLTSHTAMSNATLFDHLIDVKEGDYIFIEVLGETLGYRVDQIKVVLPNEISDLTTIAGHDYLTLFTCTPYAVNSHRLLVRGERVEYTPELAEQAELAKPPIFQLEPWMWWLLAGAAAGVVVLVLLVRRESRSRPEVATVIARTVPPTTQQPPGNGATRVDRE